MVTFTLKLGISVLNGGNVLVQQVSDDVTAHHLSHQQLIDICDLCHFTENVGLSEGETRRGVFQEFVWTHAVVQVLNTIKSDSVFK